MAALDLDRLPFLWASGQPSGCADAPRAHPAEGALVEIVGLATRPQLNHRVARVTAHARGEERAEVTLDGGPFHGLRIKVRAANLVPFGSCGGAEEEGEEAATTWHSAVSREALPWHGREEAAGPPWLPEPLARRFVREAKRRAWAAAASSGPARAGVRIISLAAAAERRAFMAPCVEELRALDVDCSFRVAVDGHALGLGEEQLQGDVTHVRVEGEYFTVDTSAWPRGGWTAELLRDVQRRFQEMRFFPCYWSAIQQNIQDPHTLGFVGGHLSHALVWQEARARDWDWVLVVEDDALPAPGLGLRWADIWRIADNEIRALGDRGEQWDILYLGRTLSMTPEGSRRVSGLLCEPGYCLRTHTYCLSKRGYCGLLDSGASSTALHCPQDEVLATFWLQDHVHAPALEMMAGLRPQVWRALAVRWRGLTAQLIDVERSDRAASSAAAPAASNAASMRAGVAPWSAPGAGV